MSMSTLSISDILKSESFTAEHIGYLLHAEGDEKDLLFKQSALIKEKYVGNIVYYRGLIEFSNTCRKDCYYCGIRSGNTNLIRYHLSDEEIIKAAHFAYENRFGSVVLQSGELNSEAFSSRIEYLVKEIKKFSNGELGITLSLGEQSEETYRRWKNAGVHRYLLRIETSNPELYKRIHPADEHHDFMTRLNCLKMLRKLGFQVGTGVMIGLPFQTYNDLANDLLFMRDFDVDMCGMGPYVEHPDTPLQQYANLLESREIRLDLALKMIAILRILMKDINIAAATALQAIDPMGREKAIKIGANIIMPNITPGKYRSSYKLYDSKPCTDDEPEDCTECLEARISMTGNKVGLGEWGDSKHFKKNS
jgi:biotin synthase